MGNPTVPRGSDPRLGTQHLAFLELGKETQLYPEPWVRAAQAVFNTLPSMSTLAWVHQMEGKAEDGESSQRVTGAVAKLHVTGTGRQSGINNTARSVYVSNTKVRKWSPQNGHPLCGRKDSISRLHVIASVALASYVACTPHRLCASWVVRDCQARRRRLGCFVLLGCRSFGDRLVIPPLCECETRQESCRPWAPWGARL